jgi:hypothetical protein
MYILANHLVKGYFWTHARDRSTPFLTKIPRLVGHGWGTKTYWAKWVVTRGKPRRKSRSSHFTAAPLSP